MDYTIAPNVTAIGSGDTAPVSGTKGEFTSGNPSTNTAATTLPGYQMNAIVEEILGAITAAGITPDRTNLGQLAAAIAAVRGRLLNITQFGTPGTATYTPTAGSNFRLVRAIGSGGAGGGAGLTTSGNGSVGVGGNGGSFIMAQYSGALSPQTVTIGAGGAGVSGGNGGQGGTTSLGSLFSIPGGKGGTSISGAASGVSFAGSSANSAATGSGIISQNIGRQGAAAFMYDGAVLSGAGGDGQEYGSAGGSVGQIGIAGDSNGQSASGFGAGGGGAFSFNGASATTGGAGSPGLIQIWEFS